DHAAQVIPLDRIAVEPDRLIQPVAIHVCRARRSVFQYSRALPPKRESVNKKQNENRFNPDEPFHFRSSSPRVDVENVSPLSPASGTRDLHGQATTFCGSVSLRGGFFMRSPPGSALGATSLYGRKHDLDQAVRIYQTGFYRGPRRKIFREHRAIPLVHRLELGNVGDVYDSFDNVTPVEPGGLQCPSNIRQRLTCLSFHVGFVLLVIAEHA